MDFQIIQDEHDCAARVVEYFNKHNRVISNLQRHIIQILDENPEFDVIDITKKISIDVLHSVEMSTQEAAWFLLREPMAKSSTPTVYIPTMYPSEHQRIRKSLKDLNELDDDWFNKYERRPNELDDVTLAQFASKHFKNNKGVYTERDAPRIIRYCNYDMDDNFDDFKREMVLLHIPFRSEDNDILSDNKFMEIYENNKDLILERRKEFELNLDMQKTLEICRQLYRDNDEKEDGVLEKHANVIFENDRFERDPNASVVKLGDVTIKEEGPTDSHQFYRIMGTANEEQKELLMRNIHYLETPNQFFCTNPNKPKYDL